MLLQDLHFKTGVDLCFWIISNRERKCELIYNTLQTEVCKRERGQGYNQQNATRVISLIPQKGYVCFLSQNTDEKDLWKIKIFVIIKTIIT
jgi:hypothetical protein